MESITHAIPTARGAGVAVRPVWQGRERGWGQGWGLTRWARGGSWIPPAPHVAAVTSGLVPSCREFACSSRGGSFRAKKF